jgi:hypothetical protein
MNVAQDLNVAQDRYDLPESEKLGLPLLNISECFSEPRGRILQTVCALAKQVVCCSVEGITEEEGSNIDYSAPLGRSATSQEWDEFLHMLLEDIGVHDAIAGKHRADKLARVGPEFSICGEDTIAEKFLPVAMEGLTFAIIGELARQKSFDILWIFGHDRASGDTCIKLGSLAVSQTPCGGD